MPAAPQSAQRTISDCPPPLSRTAGCNRLRPRFVPWYGTLVLHPPPSPPPRSRRPPSPSGKPSTFLHSQPAPPIYIAIRREICPETAPAGYHPYPLAKGPTLSTAMPLPQHPLVTKQHPPPLRSYSSLSSRSSGECTWCDVRQPTWLPSPIKSRMGPLSPGGCPLATPCVPLSHVLGSPDC